MTGVLKWTPDGVNFHPLLSGPQGPPGPAGAPGPEGGEGVEIADVPPVVPEIVLWVDPNDFQGDSGWQGFDARYVNTNGDTMTGVLKVPNAAAADDAMNRQSADARYLQLAGAGTYSVSGTVTFTGVVAVANPTLAGHAANKAYVDGRVVVAATAPASPTTGQLWATP